MSADDTPPTAAELVQAIEHALVFLHRLEDPEDRVEAVEFERLETELTDLLNRAQPNPNP